ncbi:hypothetical protein KOW79_001193 [Hemibagrus wyckioides]|uniref:Uncharacterized protein n=1 Tax=Hemibagrus wyckioides TaxID=337641 RepID=A0A9D3SS41_9TELE|nr:uncharacterized protein LOC131367820 isoform X1 [Hemibagrus wyckioides]KAG7334597.1 hypothetical protein KOW79_001193 [Hemibagrus wyckioides]
MDLLFITVVFSLALGPDVTLLKAQEVNTQMSVPQSEQSTVYSLQSETSPVVHLLKTKEHKEPTTETLTTEGEKVERPSEEHTMSTMTTQELLISAEPLITAQSTAVLVHKTMKTNDLSTAADPPGPTTNPWQGTSTMNIIITESPQTPSPSLSILLRMSMSTTESTVEEAETADTSPTTTPPITTPHTTTPPTTTPPTTTPTTTTPQTNKELTLSTTHNTVMTTHSEGATKGVSWLIIAVIALVIFCILTTLCVMAIVVKRRRQSGQQDFRIVNGQRSKKKKGTEDDVWAGPVKLGGGDCEGQEEIDAQGEQKKTDGVELAGLSTFSTLEENGGVGRPGSPEVEKWEEKEPLLFIDEEGKEKKKEVGKSEDADAKAAAGKTDAKEAEPNGGETFCLTTAV